MEDGVSVQVGDRAQQLRDDALDLSEREWRQCVNETGEVVGALLKNKEDRVGSSPDDDLDQPHTPASARDVSEAIMDALDGRGGQIQVRDGASAALRHAHAANTAWEKQQQRRE